MDRGSRRRSTPLETAWWRFDGSHLGPTSEEGIHQRRCFAFRAGKQVPVEVERDRLRPARRAVELDVHVGPRSRRGHEPQRIAPGGASSPEPRPRPSARCPAGRAGASATSGVVTSMNSYSPLGPIGGSVGKRRAQARQSSRVSSSRRNAATRCSRVIVHSHRAAPIPQKHGRGRAAQRQSTRLPSCRSRRRERGAHLLASCSRPGSNAGFTSRTNTAAICAPEASSNAPAPLVGGAENGRDHARSDSRGCGRGG